MPEVLAQMGGAFRDPGMPEALPDPAALPPGMLVPGTLNLTGRPLHIGPRGEEAFNPVASEYSYSFGDKQGREILVPTVINGRFLTPTGEQPVEGSPEEKEMQRRAKQHYEETGEHLGIFASPEAADAYAQQAHQRPIDPRRGPEYLYRQPPETALQVLRRRAAGRTIGGGEE